MRKETIIQLQNLPLLLNKQEDDLLLLKEQKEKLEFKLTQLEISHKLDILAESEREEKKKELRNADLREQALKNVLNFDTTYQADLKELQGVKTAYEKLQVLFRHNERLFSSAKSIARLLQGDE